jgi:hypothetical protein
MVDINQIGASMAGSFAGIVPELMKWMGYIITGIIILGIMYMIYILTQFKYKYIYAEEGATGIKAIKNDRIRPIKEKGVFKWQLLKTKEKIEPFDPKYIYPGNRVFGYKLDREAHLAVMWNSKASEGVEVKPREIAFWQNMEIQQAAIEYQDVKQRMIPMLMTLGTVIFCLILVGVTIWLTYKYIGGGLDSVGSSLSNLQSVIQGLAPK